MQEAGAGCYDCPASCSCLLLLLPLLPSISIVTQ